MKNQKEPDGIVLFFGTLFALIGAIINLVLPFFMIFIIVAFIKFCWYLI